MIALRLFRLFVSSTFADFLAEREALQREVFPQLERYCAARGARFQAVDLRWGITEAAQQEHRTLRICLEEVRRCQQLSPRPNFAVLLGDRYGWEPVPARIPQAHWRRLRAAASPDDRVLITASYRGDTNAVPPVYVLRPDAPEAPLRDALRRAARGFRGADRLPYFASATHQEIALGALATHDEAGTPLEPARHVHVYVRHLEDLPDDDTARDFLDWDAATGRPVPGARGRLRGLERQLRQHLGDRVHDLSTTWARHGRDGAVDETYLAEFCAAFLAHQTALIDAELGGEVDDATARAQAHAAFGAERARVFVGRGALLRRLARQVAASAESGPSSPTLLVGGGGSGKSALLARAVAQDQATSAARGAVVVARYIGGVPGTESLWALLTTLIADLAALYDQPAPAVPDNATELASAFASALAYASAERPLHVYLDALDQLDPADGAWQLQWLPTELPPHVRLVASLRAGTPVAQAAQRVCPHGVVAVPPLSAGEGRAMLRAWLADRRAAWHTAGVAPGLGRRLTPAQRAAVLAGFRATGSALWLKLAAEEAATWTSWEAPRTLPDSVPGLIGDLIDDRLLRDQHHPPLFTTRALAYLTAGRQGLSEDELGRALGTDPAVRAEFAAQEKTTRRWTMATALPPILWSRLFFDLQPYLGQAAVDGALVLRWFHREFGEVLGQRYLGTAADRDAIHGALADVFLALERECRPGAVDDEALFRATDAGGQPVSAARRRVREQPWHLAQAGRKAALEALLTDYGFAMGVCAANAAAAFIGHLLALPAAPTGSLLRAWQSLARTQGHVLRRGETHWPSHRILLQLALEYGDLNPLVAAARRWVASGRVNWTRAEKEAPQSEPQESGVRWVSSCHDHKHGHSRTSSGVRFDRAGLWSWDTTHVCHWDAASGLALHIEKMPSCHRLVPHNGIALVIEQGERVCAAYEPSTGHRAWEHRSRSRFRWVEGLAESTVALVNATETRIVRLADGFTCNRISHWNSNLPQQDWKRLSVSVLNGRWLVYQAPPSVRRGMPQGPSYVAVLDLDDGRLVWSTSVSRVEPVPQWDHPFLSTRNPLGMRSAGEHLMVWTGEWMLLDPHHPGLGVRAIEREMRTALHVSPEVDGEAPSSHDARQSEYWDSFVPVCSNANYHVFIFRGALVARHHLTGQVASLSVAGVVGAGDVHWAEGNTLVAIDESDEHPPELLRWSLDEGITTRNEGPLSSRWMIVTTQGETVVVSRRYVHDLNEGYVEKSEPLLAVSGSGLDVRMIHSMNRVECLQDLFRHAWIDPETLVVLDGQALVCMSVAEGESWSEGVETSFGVKVNVSEDWTNVRRMAIIGSERWAYIDASETPARVKVFKHSFSWGATGELSGDELLLWHDDNAAGEFGQSGEIALWRRTTDGGWESGPECLLAIEAMSDFDMFGKYCATHRGSHVLIGQGESLLSLQKDASGKLSRSDVLQGGISASEMWIRGGDVYVPGTRSGARMCLTRVTSGKFSQVKHVSRRRMLRAGEESLVNVRPYRDMALGPMQGMKMFVVGQAIGPWTVLDGSLGGHERTYITFKRADGQEARWYGRRPCRILRHRVDYADMERSFFSTWERMAAHSLTLEGDKFFVCEEDGAAWMIKLARPGEAS